MCSNLNRLIVLIENIAIINYDTHLFHCNIIIDGGYYCPNIYAVFEENLGGWSI